MRDSSLNERADALKATLVFLTPGEVKVRVIHRSIERELVAALDSVKSSGPYLINVPIWDK